MVAKQALSKAQKNTAAPHKKLPNHESTSEKPPNHQSISEKTAKPTQKKPPQKNHLATKAQPKKPSKHNLPT
jgi:hypothetical protein